MAKSNQLRSKRPQRSVPKGVGRTQELSLCLLLTQDDPMHLTNASILLIAFYGAGAGYELICMQPPTIWQSWLGNLRELQLSTNLAELWVLVT